MPSLSNHPASAFEASGVIGLTSGQAQSRDLHHALGAQSEIGIAAPMTIAWLDSRPPIKSFALRFTKHFVRMIRTRIPGPHQQLDAHFEFCCTLPAAADGGPAQLETVAVQPQHLCTSILLGNVGILRVAGFA